MADGVVNVRLYRVGPRQYAIPAGVVYVGRGGGRVGLPRSEWSNPFPVNIFELLTQAQARARAIDQFRAHAEARLAADPAWLDPLIGMTLACHCDPEPCHASVLRELVARRAAELAAA